MKKILKGLLLAMLAALLAVCAACGSAEVRVKLGTSSVVLRPGETEKLTAELPQGGTAVWKSDDERVALVTQDGMVTAVSVGSAAVSVTCGGSSDYCQITVTEQGQTSVSDEQNKEGYLYYEDFDGRDGVPNYLRISRAGGGYLSVENGEMTLGTQGGGSAFASYLFDGMLSGTVVAEARVKVSDRAFSNILFFYRGEAGYDNGDVIACLGMNNGGFTNHDGSGWSGSILGYSLNTYYEVRMVLEIGAGKYQLYINGKQYADQTFRKRGDGVEDRIKLLKFGTDKSGAELTYDYIRISLTGDASAPAIAADGTTVSAAVGGTAKLGYRVTGSPRPTVTVTPLDGGTVGEDLHTVTPPAAAGAYRFRVRAENEHGADEKVFTVLVRSDPNELLNTDFSELPAGMELESNNGVSEVKEGMLHMQTGTSSPVLTSARYDFGEALSGKVRADVRVKNDSAGGTFMNILFLYRRGTASFDAAKCTSSVAIENGALKYHNGSGWQTLVSVQSGEWLEISVLYDFDSYTMTVELNGETVLENGVMRRASDDTSVLLIGSDKTGGEMYYDSLRFVREESAAVAAGRYDA